MLVNLKLSSQSGIIFEEGFLLLLFCPLLRAAQFTSGEILRMWPFSPTIKVPAFGLQEEEV